MLPPDEYDIAATAERLRGIFSDRQVWFDHRFDLEEWAQRNARAGYQVARQLIDLDCGRAAEPGPLQDGARQTVLNFLAHAYGYEGGPDEVRAFVDGTFPLSIEDAVKFAAFLGCKVGDFSPYHQRRIDAVALFATGEEEVERLHYSLEETETHLKSIAAALPGLLKPAQQALSQRIVASVRAELAGAEPPEEIEGFANALDYMGLLQEEGSSHQLYELGMDTLESLIGHQLDALAPADQVAVLLPLCVRSRMADPVEDLVLNLDVSVDEWAQVLRKQLWEGWSEPLREAVLATIPPQSRRE